MNTPNSKGLVVLQFCWWVVLITLWGFIVAGCGLKTPPAPKMNDAQPIEIGFVTRLVDNQTVASWWIPSPTSTADRGGVKEFTLLAQSYPTSCPVCPAEFRQKWTLDPDDPKLHREGSRAYYVLEIPELVALWRVQFAITYRNGMVVRVPETELATPVYVPAHKIQGQWLTLPTIQLGATANGKALGDTVVSHQLRLFWADRRERVVRILSPKVAPTERELFFRVNLYVREPGAQWPFTPINITPLSRGQWIVNPGKTAPVYPKSAKLQYTLRLVDQWGNEGPAAPPFSIDAASFYQ